MATYDVIIHHGLIVDGSGEKGFAGDVAIEGDSIAAVGDLKEASARQRIDASGWVVAPGFIDIHTHSDVMSLIIPTGDSKVHNGVTTEVVCSCGTSPYPQRGSVREQRQKDLARYGLAGDWEDIEGYKAEAEAIGYSLNRVLQVGQGAIRAFVMGLDNRPPTAKELKEMKSEVRLAMEAGAFGLSSGLLYAPGCYADRREIAELCKVVKEYDGIYSTHMRNEGDELLAAVQEVLDIQEASGVRVEIAHVKAIEKHNWHKTVGLKMMLDQAIDRGADLTCDRYPYTASATSLDSILPPWVYEGGTAEEVKRLKDPATRKALIQEVQAKEQDEEYWQSIVISYVASEKNKHFEGMRLSEVAEALGTDPLEAALTLIVEEERQVSAIYFWMSEDNLREILKWPFVMIGSDSSARAVKEPFARGKPHPRGFGTAARVLGRYVRGMKVFTLEQAVWKLAGYPAQRLNLNRRGQLKRGYFADVTIFNPDTIIDKATYLEPKQYSVGVEYVFVNGKPVQEQGTHTGARPGRILTGPES